MGRGSTQGLPAQIVYGVLSEGIYVIRALCAHIKAVDKVRVQSSRIVKVHREGTDKVPEWEQGEKSSSFFLIRESL